MDSLSAMVQSVAIIAAIFTAAVLGWLYAALFVRPKE